MLPSPSTRNLDVLVVCVFGLSCDKEAEGRFVSNRTQWRRSQRYKEDDVYLVNCLGERGVYHFVRDLPRSFLRLFVTEVTEPSLTPRRPVGRIG